MAEIVPGECFKCGLFPVACVWTAEYGCLLGHAKAVDLEAEVKELREERDKWKREAAAEQEARLHWTALHEDLDEALVAAEAELKELREERDEWKHAYLNVVPDSLVLPENEVLMREVQRAVASEAREQALREYAEHGLICPATPGWAKPAPCTCGLDALLAQPGAEVEG